MDLIADDQTRTSHGQTSQSCGRGFKHPLEAIQSIDKACFLLRDFKSTKPFLTVHATELIDASCSRNTVFRCELSSSSPGESTRRNETGKEPEAAQGAEAEKTWKNTDSTLPPSRRTFRGRKASQKNSPIFFSDWTCSAARDAVPQRSMESCSSLHSIWALEKQRFSTVFKHRFWSDSKRLRVTPEISWTRKLWAHLSPPCSRHGWVLHAGHVLPWDSGKGCSPVRWVGSREAKVCFDVFRIHLGHTQLTLSYFLLYDRRISKESIVFTN